MAQQSTTAVALRGVAKHYQDFVAVHPMHLDIAEASFVTFLGPSGCGKTTTLRMIAGLASVTAGEILIRDRRINDVPIHKRNLGLVFQNYALFPHKSVYDNVAFGLKYRDVDKAEIRRRVTETLELVQLPHTAERMPGQLSGGQQQRIALARAIVIQPDVLLLDEPLSALDANLREDMRIELKRIQRELGVTTFFVTHDQSEALAMSDQVVVMSAGRVEQIGSPQEVYDRPASEFVANFLGHSNILDGRVAARDGATLRIDVAGLGAVTVAAAQHGGDPAVGRTVKLTVRAEKLWLGRPPGGPGELTQLEGTIQTLDYQGQSARYFVQIGEHTVQAINTIDEQPLAEGAKVSVYIRARDCVLLPDAPAEAPSHA